VEEQKAYPGLANVDTVVQKGKSQELEIGAENGYPLGEGAV
jgi:hypothetical protein